MISALSGELRTVANAHVELEAGPIVYQLLVPAIDVPALQELIGRSVTFHTILYLEGDASRGNQQPRLLGFLRPQDRRFFELFVTVKGIGPKRAMRALSQPVGMIAHAIESRDTRFLTTLPEIGKRTAEQIVAELAGKAAAFAAPGGARSVPSAVRRPPAEEDAIIALLALGERRAEAEDLLDRARRADGELKTTDALLREMLRLRAGRG